MENKNFEEQIKRILHPLNYKDTKFWIRRNSMMTRNLPLEEWSELYNKHDWQKILIDFDQNNQLKGLSIITRAKALYIIQLFSIYVKKNYKSINKEDIKKYIVTLQGATGVNNLHKIYIKSLFKFIYKCEKRGKYPLVVDWIEIPSLKLNSINKSECLEFDDIKKMIKVVDSPRNKALISGLPDSGARISEFLGVNVGDIEVNGRDIIIKLQNAKSRNNQLSYRKVLLVDSYYYMVQWLRQHPLIDNTKEYTDVVNKDIPLFVNYERKNKDKRLSYFQAYNVIRKAGEDAKIKKNFNPHWFRHSSVKLAESELTDSELRQRFGWERNSQMVGRYSHLSSEDVIEKQRIQHGLEEPDKEKKSNKPIFKECPKCLQSNNLNITNFCSRCGSALSVKVLMEQQEKIERADKIFRKTGILNVDRTTLKETINEMIKSGEISIN